MAASILAALGLAVALVQQNLWSLDGCFSSRLMPCAFSARVRAYTFGGKIDFEFGD